VTFFNKKMKQIDDRTIFIWLVCSYWFVYWMQNNCIQSLSNCCGLWQLSNGVVPTYWWQSKINRRVLFQEEGRLVMELFCFLRFVLVKFWVIWFDNVSIFWILNLCWNPVVLWSMDLLFCWKNFWVNGTLYSWLTLSH